MLVHGGCWVNLFGLEFMRDMAVDLAGAGVASVNIEYRRIGFGGPGDPGAGYPGTFTDVGTAFDKVRDLAPLYDLNLDNVIAVGHSAGGHLALWAATRDRLPPESPLFAPDPLPLRGVIDLAGVVNLAESLDLGACVGLAADLLGGTPDEVPERYAETSPAERLPIGVPQVVIHGTSDDLITIVISEHYVEAARDAGDHPVSFKKVHGANHFDLITPSSPKWPQIEERILEMIDE